MKKLEELSKYYCLNPFKRIEINIDNVFTCCQNWISESIGSTNDLKSIKNGDKLRNVRMSVLDGTFKYCDKYKCPYLSPFIFKDDNVKMFKKIRKKDDANEIIKNSKITEINISIDDSCNLSCPSCRTNIKYSNYDKLSIAKNKMDNIIEIFGKDLETIIMQGSGDPIASKVYRDFLLNFDESKFPNLKEIVLHTNALLLTEEMWNKLNKVNKYIKKLLISIDASDEEMYKIVRRGGDWNILIKNLHFLSNVKTIKKIDYLFVVQDINYKQMNSFVYLINSIPRINNFSIFFSKVHNLFGSFTDDEYEQKKIWQESHPEFKNFLIELEKTINFKKNVKIYTDMNDIIYKYSLSGKKNII